MNTSEQTASTPFPAIYDDRIFTAGITTISNVKSECINSNIHIFCLCPNTSHSRAEPSIAPGRACTCVYSSIADIIPFYASIIDLYSLVFDRFRIYYNTTHKLFMYINMKIKWNWGKTMHWLEENVCVYIRKWKIIFLSLYEDRVYFLLSFSLFLLFSWLKT